MQVGDDDEDEESKAEESKAEEMKEDEMVGVAVEGNPSSHEEQIPVGHSPPQMSPDSQLIVMAGPVGDGSV